MGGGLFVGWEGSGSHCGVEDAGIPASCQPFLMVLDTPNLQFDAWAGAIGGVQSRRMSKACQKGGGG